MTSAISRIMLASVLVALLTASTRAQDFRIVTDVETLPIKGQQRSERVSVTALSLFHAGQAYDRVFGVPEVTIYQPARQQFTILSQQHSLATRITFDEIAQKQRVLEKDAREAIGTLTKEGTRNSLAMVAAIQFQLSPEFVGRYDEKRRVLSMTHEQISYTVQCQSIGNRNPQLVADYIDYADWMARLNLLLHAQAMFPTPRLLVNDELRNRQVMPIVVERVLGGQNGLHQRASHQIRWELTKLDRQTIKNWTDFLDGKSQKGANVKWVKFEDFREAIRGE